MKGIAITFFQIAIIEAKIIDRKSIVMATYAVAALPFASFRFADASAR